MIINNFVLLFLLIAIPATALQSATEAINKTVDGSAADDCLARSNGSTTFRVVVLFDITPEYATNFRNQQHRLFKTLRHIDQRVKGHQRFYALVAFHRTSVVLSGLNYAHAKNVEKIIDQITGLNPRRRLETAPSKAFETAAELLEYHQNSDNNSSDITNNNNNIVLLVHDGLNTDSQNETFEAISKLSNNETAIFAITGSVKPNEQILTEYTGQRSHVLAKNDDMEQFFQALDDKINPCESLKAESLKNKIATPTTKLRDDTNRTGDVEILLLPENDSNAPKNFVSKISQKLDEQFAAVKREQQHQHHSSVLSRDLKLECNNIGKVDLMLLLDTSGSIYRSFPQQRHLALQILHSIEPALHAMQIGVIQFAHEPTVIHSLQEPTADTQYNELLNRVRDLVFTGRNTRIADALELALNEFDKHGRKDAQKVLILISDGHGQEFWHRAAQVAHRLATTRVLQRFAVSSSLDYNLEELMLYMGDSRRIFVGQRSLIFMPTIIAFLNKCLPNTAKKIGTTQINLDENGIRVEALSSAVDAEAEAETTAAAVVDEFSTVANLSLMLREEASNNINNNNNNNTDEAETEDNASANPGKFSSAARRQLLPDAAETPLSSSAADDDVGVEQNGTNSLPTTPPAPPPLTMASGKQEMLNNKNNSQKILVDNERDAPMMAEEEEKNDEQIAKTEREQTLRKVIPAEKRNPSNVEEIECDTDVLIMLDRARPDQAFAQQVALAKHLVAKIAPEEIASGKTRVAIIAFGTEATTEVAWNDKVPRRQILQKLDLIRQFNSATSFVHGAKLALDEVSRLRRPNARLLATAFWSGLTGRDNETELFNAMQQFNAINRTQLYVVSLNAKANLTRLKELAGGDQWHVFVEGRANQFVGQASQYLLDCVLPPSGVAHDELDQLDNHEPLNSVERVEHLQAAARAFQKQPLGNCKDDLVDLALLLHFRPQTGSSSNELAAQFHAMRRAAMATLRQAPADHYQKRIRLSLLINARVLVSLKTAIDLDDALFALDRGQLEQLELDGTVPLADKLQMSIDDLRQFHREGARVVILVLSNDEQQRLNPDEQQSRLIIKGLDRLSASLFILHFAPRGTRPNDGGTLSAQFNGSDTERIIRVFSTSGKISQFVDEFRRKTFMCKKKFDAKFEVSHEEEKVASSDSTSIAPSTEESKQIASSSSVDDDGPIGNETVAETSSGSVKLVENENGAELDNNNGSPNEILSNVNLRAANLSDTPLTLEQVDSAPDEQHSQNVTMTTSENDEISLLNSNNDHNNNATTTTVQQNIDEETTVTIASSTTVAAAPTTTVATITTTTTTKQQSAKKTLPKFVLSEADHPRVFLLGDECKVDLMFIIDTSQSVQEAFEQQLQFAVDLVKRLPDQDFAQRVQVGAVSFNKKAQVQFSLGALKEKPAILDTLLHINHTGGGTSVVNGVNLAMDEVAKHRRNGTRLMVVLISDGTSQDPWAEVLRSADRLRAAEADVYAVTVSHDYFFRELELYAGNKWFVYIDARIRQFLDEAEMSLVECKSPTMPSLVLRDVRNDEDGNNDTTTVSASASTMQFVPKNMTTAKTTTFSSSSTAADANCDKDLVDLMFIIDTSTSVQKEFYAEKNFALDLVRVLPEQDFPKRISIAMVKFRGTADIHFHFHPGRSREDIIYDIERVEHTGGETSLASAAELAFREIFRLRRPEARLIVVIITDGNSQDEWKNVKAAAKKLRDSTGGNGVYALTLSEKYSVEELREYTGTTEKNLYANSRTDQFIQEVGNLISQCPGGGRDGIKVTPVPDVEASTTPSSTPMPSELNASIEENNSTKAKDANSKKQNKEDEVAKARDENPIRTSREDELFDETRGAEMLTKCKPSKMDLIIILDASTSRENVFEHQRELALSLIERLPISREGTHIATGIISFTNNPMLRQSLGLGRDRKIVRKTIEDIKYRGGSTLTSKAVELALQDMKRGTRLGARQVIILMNDGMSQDPWEQVLKSSQNLANSGAERFGVALGSEVDLRELHLYIGGNERIYRDGSTERFLRDIVALASVSSENCPPPPTTTKLNNNAKIKAVPIHRNEKRTKMRSEIVEHQFEFQLDVDNHCEKPNVDMLIMFDNVISSERNNDNLKMNSNRYLLLDLLGSLPADGRVRVALISAGGPRLEYRFVDPQDRDALATRVERMRPLNGAPNYATGIERALDHYASAGRDDARAILLIVGNGNGTTEPQTQRQFVENRLKQMHGLVCFAVDSGKSVDIPKLVQYTGSPQRIFAFDRNAEFAKFLLDNVTTSSADQCQTQQQHDDQIVARSLLLFKENGTAEKLENDNLTKKNAFMNHERQRDIGLIKLENEKTFDNDKLVNKQQNGQTKHHVPSLSILLSSLRETNQKNKSSTNSISSTTTTTTKPTTASTIHAEPFRPGCLIDLLLIIDASGSIHGAFEQEKMFASQIVQQIRIGPNNARVAIVKFASSGKVRTVHGFDSVQDKALVLQVIKNMTFSDGTTAIHSALEQAMFAYSALRGARPGVAEPVAVVFTDGFGQHEFDDQATQLRRLIPRVYALAVQQDGGGGGGGGVVRGTPIAAAHAELAKITGSPRNVFTALTFANLYDELQREQFSRGC